MTASLLFEKFGPKSPVVYDPRAKSAFWDRPRTLTENISAKEHNIKSTIGKKLVNQQGFPACKFGEL